MIGASFLRRSFLMEDFHKIRLCLNRLNPRPSQQILLYYHLAITKLLRILTIPCCLKTKHKKSTKNLFYLTISHFCTSSRWHATHIAAPSPFFGLSPTNSSNHTMRMHYKRWQNDDQCITRRNVIAGRGLQFKMRSLKLKAPPTFVCRRRYSWNACRWVVFLLLMLAALYQIQRRRQRWMASSPRRCFVHKCHSHDAVCLVRLFVCCFPACQIAITS